ncbi:MAG: TRAP transporter substrate-binding protein [Gammaproteobacteria bacterium]|nr:MAG: TRAP transporter substrate-binding protein [Gammaproteobacteria bacterium]
MKRREFLKTMGTGTVVAGTGLVAACGPKECPTVEAAAVVAAGETFEWKMVTAWPLNFPGLGTGANYLARIIGEMSGGRITVKVYGGGELVPPFEAFDAVSRGTVEMGHAAPYYWKGKTPTAQLFSAVPFGMTASEMNGWFYHGEGLDLWRETYEPFNMVPFPAGQSGVQMGGWFNKEINSVADLQGLKMRIPGLGAEVLKRAGGTPVTLPGAELFTALESGTIDATEWVGPYNDLAFGLFRAAGYYYYPGWHEPTATLECFINGDAWRALPADLQAIVEQACKAATQDMTAEFTARNPAALEQLVSEHGVQLRRFPDDVLVRLKTIAAEVVAEIGAIDALSRRVYDSYMAFMAQVRRWHDISDLAYLEARNLGPR